MEPSNNFLIKVDDTFESYEELSRTVELFEKQERVQFWKRDCRTLKSARNHAPKIAKIANPALKYYGIKYSCQRGGQKFRPKKTSYKAKRRHEGTLKQQCKAEIKLGLTTDGQSLIVKSICYEHNHPIPSKEIFLNLPRQRRFNNEAKITAITMMKLKANKKLLLAETYEKNERISTTSKLDTSDIEDIVTQLKEKYKCTVHVQMKENTFRNMFFQNERMRKSFELFPEVLFLDVSYKLLNVSVYILAIENSFGLTDVVGVGILTKYISSAINWMISRFKERNLKWNDIQLIISDKNTFHTIEPEFPNAQKIICFTQALQHFRKEITPKNLNITHDELLPSLEYIRKLAYSSTEENYNSTFEEMKFNVPNEVITYYKKNWHHIRHKWVNCFTNSVILANNRIETLNSKLKSVISTQTTFLEFIDKLFIVLNVKEIELRKKYTNMLLKGPKELRLETKCFHEYLTTFAFKKIQDNLVDVQESENKEYTFKKEGRYTFCITKDGKCKFKIFENQCECNFFKSMMLPCKHLLVFRKHRGLELFNSKIIGERWSRTHIQPLFDISGMSHLTAEIREELEDDDMDMFTEKTELEKRKQAQTVCHHLVNLCSEATTEEFNKRIDVLLELKASWENNENATVWTENMTSAVEYLEDEFNDEEIDSKLNICAMDVHADHDYYVPQSDDTNIYHEKKKKFKREEI